MMTLNVAFLTDIGDYLKNCNNRFSLAQFVISHQEATKLFIRQFDSEIKAKKKKIPLVNKYNSAFKNVFPARKKITGKAVRVVCN